MKKPGDINPKHQKVLRITDASGTDYNSRIWILKCGNCSWIYGCNSTDAWERKCPNCQQGQPGLPIPTERDGEDWNWDEHVIAFHVYSGIEFGKIHMGTLEVKELAAILGRKVGSASRKLANFARLDPVLRRRDVRGLEHGSKGEEEVWGEFGKHPEELAYESARLLSERVGRPIEQVAEIDETDLPPRGIEREVLVKLRVNQSFFRKRVLSAYEFRCCITGLKTQALLVASHIVPWAEDETHRLNPKNGLCLNALHDRLFDRHLMWIDEDLTVRLSTSVRETDDAAGETLKWLKSFDGKPLLLPKRFRPDGELLDRHSKRCKITAYS